LINYCCFSPADGKLLPISLQEVTVKVQTNAECQKSYQQDAPGGINNDMLCAAYPKKDSCMVKLETIFQSYQKKTKQNEKKENGQLI
jgi:hypothetical protein